MVLMGSREAKPRQPPHHSLGLTPAAEPAVGKGKDSLWSVGWSEIFTEKNRLLEVLFVIHHKPRPGRGALPGTTLQGSDPRAHMLPPLEPPWGCPPCRVLLAPCPQASSQMTRPHCSGKQGSSPHL